MIMGAVTLNNSIKGLGFIKPDDGSKDIPTNAVALERAAMGDLAQGRKVAFETNRDVRSGRIAISDIETN